MRIWLVLGLGAVAAASMAFVPPIRQDPSYHSFAEQRTILGVPNFWNVVSNGAFLLAGAAGLQALRRREAFAEPWERATFAIFVIGIVAVAFGSGYYHWHPDNRTLFWDRLPMTVGFMSLLAAILGERAGSNYGRWLLVPLIVAGVASVRYWRMAGDLRWYGLPWSAAVFSAEV